MFRIVMTHIVTARSELRKVLFGAVCDFFVCVWNISGIAERICDKFTRKTCLIPRWDEFDGQGQNVNFYLIGTNGLHY